jgi:hypothetical protein
MNSIPSDEIEKESWKGCIPVQLSLSPMSLSSPTMPHPIHKLIPRHSYLHVALEEEVRNFHQYAPISFRSMGIVTNDEGENDDEIQGENMDNNGTTRSVEIDGKKDNSESLTQNEASQQSQSNLSSENAYPLCWFEDEETRRPLQWNLFVGIIYDLLRLRKSASCVESFQHSMLPWKLRVHFTTYPDTILPLSVAETDDDVLKYVFQHYLNSLKQSLYLQSNSARIAKNLNKQSHIKLWKGIVNNCWEGPFREVVMELHGSRSKEHIINNVPIRVLVDGRPSFTRPCNPRTADGELITIGEVLEKWLPGLFAKKFHWCIQGIEVPLECPVSELWKVLCHPDRFIYVLVVVDDLHTNASYKKI